MFLPHPCFTNPLLVLALAPFVHCTIDRQSIVRQFNLHLIHSHPYSPVQVGNGNFAFGADITGLQTFVPHNTLSSWGWHNSSLPTTPNQTQTADFTGMDWWTHDRLVNYAQPNPAEKDISQWMISNPHRINLSRIGLYFVRKNISEEDLEDAEQVVDFWEGVVNSQFALHGKRVKVMTVADPDTDTVAVRIKSELVKDGELGVFFDFPYASGKNKFDAPFVGVWNETEKHETYLRRGKDAASIRHTLDATTYDTEIVWEGGANIERESNSSHRYILSTADDHEGDNLIFTATFTPIPSNTTQPSFFQIKQSAAKWWSSYWNSGAFLSVPIFSNSSAFALQKRIIQSQYLTAVNGAGHDPPQESGLVNNGWYGKFHMEMIFWHLAHWQIWDKWSLYSRSTPSIYDRFLETSMERAEKQGYKGARWPKMVDPSGRSAPGEINSLLIWQQVHPMWFAEMEWRKDPSNVTLAKWDAVLEATADFMASYAYYNASTHVYDLGPPMYPVSENTPSNATINPTFELAYWRFGLDIAEKWKARQGKHVPPGWKDVRENLAPFPVEDGVYVLYEGVQDMWNTSTLSEDHPGFLGLYGQLPPDPERFDLTTFTATLDKVYENWNFTYSYGWDFPLLAMTAARMGDAEQAVRWLLHEEFKFDEVGMPVGGTRVATPYFPASAGLLLAVGMMAGGWDGKEGLVLPEGWEVEAEGFQKAM